MPNVGYVQTESHRQRIALTAAEELKALIKSPLSAKPGNECFNYVSAIGPSLECRCCDHRFRVRPNGKPFVLAKTVCPKCGFRKEQPE